METLANGIVGIITAAVGAYLGVYFDRKWPQDAKPRENNASTFRRSGKKLRSHRARKARSHTHVYTTNIMTTIANTVGLLATVAFAYDMANASHIVFAAMAFFFLLDVILNVFLLTPRHTFKIPLICSAFAGFVMWVGAVYVDRAFGGQDVTLLDSVYLRALFVTIFGYAAIASLLLEFRRRAL